MLNRAARYFPILREIGRLVDLQNGCQLLEVGSGPTGVGEFWAHRFVGCDTSFAERPHAPMRAVRCSGCELPFPDESFDVVVVSDVMEHVPPVSRRSVVLESLRVSRGVAVIGYPCGPLAQASDRKLRESYLTRGVAPPVWLQEHMEHPFPGGELFSELPRGWKVKSIPNEYLTFHRRMMHLEMNRLIDHFFRLTLRIFPRLVEGFLRRMDREPSYRRIFVVTRERL